MSDSVRPHRWQPTRLPHPWDSPGKNSGLSCHFLLQCMKVKSESEVAQSCPTLSNPMDCSLPGSSVHGVFQARVLEWVAIAFSRIPVELFQILKDDAVKMLHSICQQIWTTQHDHRTGKVSFYSNPKERKCQRMIKLSHNYTHLTCQ